MIGIIKRNFIHVDSNTFCLLYKALVRPHLEYAHSVGLWCPHKKEDITEIEKVQKRATKLIISFKKFPYKERLRRLNLPTLKYRSMIEVFKIINNIYDASSVPILPLDTSSVTRGNSFKLSNLRFYHDIRKYAFVPRIINLWNSLPDFVVKVDSINVFKNRLDKYWSHQDFMFDYTAAIAGIGDRSEFTVDIDLS